MRHISVAIVLTLVILQASAADVFWPPKDPASLVGKVGCDFPEESGVGRFSVSVVGQEGYRLEYRKSGESLQYVLLMKERSAESCDAIVVSVVLLPRYPETMRVYEVRDRYVADLFCRYLGVDFETNVQAFGIVDQQRPSSGYFMPRKAWRVNTVRETLEPVDADLVVCSSFSVHDSRGRIER